MDSYSIRIDTEEKETVSTYIAVGILVALAAGGIYFFFLSDRAQKEVTGFDPNRPLPTDAVLKRRIGLEAFSVVREGKTQMAFHNDHWNNWRPGIYCDVVTGEPLFSSADKYEANVGVPSFTKPIAPDLMIESLDTRYDMQRTQLQSKRSKAWLGHRFEDPSSPTGQRYSINSASLRFTPVEVMNAEGYEALLPLVEKK